MRNETVGGLTDTILSFANLVATYALPGPVGKMVTTVLPLVANMVLPKEAVEAIVRGTPVTQKIITQDGQVFTIVISRDTTPEVFAALANAHAAHLARDVSGQDYGRTEQFFPLEVVLPNGPQAGGSVSILNGILGVSW